MESILPPVNDHQKMKYFVQVFIHIHDKFVLLNEAY